MSFITLGKLSPGRLEKFVAAQRRQTVTYRGPVAPTPGFRFTRTLVPLGYGPDVFAKAVAGLEAWAVYPAWITRYPNPAPLREGVVVALATGVTPLWTLSAVRIVAVTRTPQRVSLTIATLPQHAVSGSERFCIYLDEQARVCYELTAVSRARGPLVKLGAPVLRLVQAQFAKDSVRSLRRFVASV